MVRIARERMTTLFTLAEREAATGHADLADRYVTIARRIGTRYNARVLPEYRELYCRGCSAFWVEGRSVRTRFRGGHRTRTCLRCGRERRTVLHGTASLARGVVESGPSGIPRDGAILVESTPDEEPNGATDDETEEE